MRLKVITVGQQQTHLLGTAITGSLVGGSSTEVDYYSIIASGNGLLSVSFSDTDTSGADSYDHYMVLQDASVK